MGAKKRPLIKTKYRASTCLHIDPINGRRLSPACYPFQVRFQFSISLVGSPQAYIQLSSYIVVYEVTNSLCSQLYAESISHFIIIPIEAQSIKSEAQ